MHLASDSIDRETTCKYREIAFNLQDKAMVQIIVQNWESRVYDIVDLNRSNVPWPDIPDPSLAIDVCWSRFSIGHCSGWFHYYWTELRARWGPGDATPSIIPAPAAAAADTGLLGLRQNYIIAYPPVYISKLQTAIQSSVSRVWLQCPRSKAAKVWVLFHYFNYLVRPVFLHLSCREEIKT